MPLEVAIYEVHTRHRSRSVCQAMLAGINRIGDRARIIPESSYKRPIPGNVAVFYGLQGRCVDVFRDYRAAGQKAVYVDLGYWGRRYGGRFNGFHKVSVGDRHPTAYFQNRQHDSARFQVFEIPVRPWSRDGKHILVAGMSDKGARAEGFLPEQWERRVIEKLRRVTDRPIIYRPKPSWLGSHPIQGAGFDRSDRSISEALIDCYAVVTHHSNASVDGLLAGVPSFCIDGCAAPLSLRDFSKIEEPLYPDGREQWAADLAWTQWSIEEMSSGAAWRYLKDEGLVQ